MSRVPFGQGDQGRRVTGRLNVKLGIVEHDCQDWHAEATNVFIEGTEIGASSRRCR